MGRWVLLATILGSGIAFLDATVVNVALPTIGEDLDAGIASLQWVVNAYTLTLSSLCSSAAPSATTTAAGGCSCSGSSGSRRRCCAASPRPTSLIAARALQGVGGALLTPGSLAIIEASFAREDRGPAIGAWSGLGGVAAAVGPFLGGWLVQAASWRLVFLINLPLAAVVVWVSVRHVPESRDPGATGRLDWAGAALAAVGLAGVVYALTDGPAAGWTSPRILATGLVGVAALVAFVLWERHPGAHAAAGHLRLAPVQRRQRRHLRGLRRPGRVAVPHAHPAPAGGRLVAAGLRGRPGPGHPRHAAAVGPVGPPGLRIGPRLPMTLGPLLVAAGFVLFTRIGPGASYLVDVLPASLVYGLGLVLTVAPLTATVLAAAPAEHAGIASAVNNDVARTAGLLAVAVLPVAAGISGADALEPARFAAGFRSAMTIAAVLCAAGGVLSWLTIRNPEPEPEPSAPPPELPAQRALAGRPASLTAGVRSRSPW